MLLFEDEDACALADDAAWGVGVKGLDERAAVGAGAGFACAAGELHAEEAHEVEFALGRAAEAGVGVASFDDACALAEAEQA